MNFIGKEIKKYRKNRGLSQKELGEKMNVSQAMIAQYENGKRIPKLETINNLAEALGIDPFSLYSFEMSTEILENSINDAEKPLLDNYRKLNKLGKDKAIEHVEMLTKIPEYKNEED